MVGASRHVFDSEFSENSARGRFRPVVLIEMLAQTAACLAATMEGAGSGRNGQMRLAQLREIELSPLPRPPFSVELTVEHVMDWGDHSLCIGRAQIAGRTVCTGKWYLFCGKTND